MKRLLPVVAVMFAVLFSVAPVSAATTVKVQPSNLQGFSTAGTVATAGVGFVEDGGAPIGAGTLLLNSPTPGAEAKLFKATSTPLSGLTAASYKTRLSSSNLFFSNPTYRLIVDLDADGATDTDLVFEPFLNNAVQPDVWQSWDVLNGQFWSSQSVGSLQAGNGGPPTYSLSYVKAEFPNAIVKAFGVNTGSYQSSVDAQVDALVFNDITYNFELDDAAPEQPVLPTNKDQCKDDGWQNFGTTFKNQGQCVAFVNSGGSNFQSKP